MVDKAVDSLQLVARELGPFGGDEGKTRMLRMSRTLAAPIGTVWAAITEFDRIRQWFMPVAGEAMIGGHYQLEGNAGGEILACEAPRTLRITWEYGGDVSYVTVNLAEKGSGATLFDFEHAADVEPDRWAEYGPGAVASGGTWDCSGWLDTWNWGSRRHSRHPSGRRATRPRHSSREAVNCGPKLRSHRATTRMRLQPPRLARPLHTPGRSPLRGLTSD